MTTVALAPVPKLQFFDNNGDPLSGGKLYTYVVGTTTNKATYTDATGNSANANPVILDSRGEASVWLLTDANYKFVLKTAADVTINTIDNFGFASPTFQDVTVTNDVTVGGDVIVTGAISATGGVTGGEWLWIYQTDQTATITTGTAKFTFRLPACTLNAVRTNLVTASSSGLPAFDLNDDGVSVFSVTSTIDVGELTSVTAATASVIANSTIADDSKMTIDIDTAGTGAKGWGVGLKFTRTQ